MVCFDRLLWLQGPTHFVQGGWDSFCAEARGPRGQAGAQKRYGTAAFGWGGLGGSAIWFNPVEKIGFGYSVTGVCAQALCRCV